VIATMRVPRADLLPGARVLPLDVSDAASIERLIAAAGPIDVLVNNAGIGMLGALEGVDMSTARQVFETNTLGAIAMTQAVLPQFRQRRDGIIINVTSAVTLKALPLLAVYTASKAALDAFTETVALELRPFNIRTHIVLPGRAPDTSFGANARDRLQTHDAYAALTQSVFAEWAAATEAVTQTQDVAEAIWRAATDAAAPLRIAAGADALALM
jgi:NAD(P)-dependent dehydrogenase (short-subunit alcohol dehydrogenase family)